jgi:hypothetical protein
MTGKQIIRLTTPEGTEDLDADRVLIESEEYVILNGQVEVRRIAIADIVAEGESSGIETIYSRS